MGMLGRARRSWEVETERPSESSSASTETDSLEQVRTSGEISWMADPVPSKLGARKQRPASPPSPRYTPKPAGEAHWTSAFGSTTDWTVPGGLDTPEKRSAGRTQPLDEVDIDLGCSGSAWGPAPEPEPEPEPERHLRHTERVGHNCIEGRRNPSRDDKPVRYRRPAALLPPPSPTQVAESLVEEIAAVHAAVLPAAFGPATPVRHPRIAGADDVGFQSPDHTSPPEPVRNSWTAQSEAQPAAVATVETHAQAKSWTLHDLIHTPASAETLTSTQEREISYGYTPLGQRLVREIFLRFDVDRDGHLSKAELRRFAMATEGEVYDDETLNELLKSFRSGPRGLTLAGFMALYRETELMDLAQDARQLQIQL